MKIRYKILLVLSLIMISIMASLYYAAQYIMFSSIAASEEQYAKTDAFRFVRNLSNIEFAALNNTACDWAIWDDTYNFVLKNDSAYIQTNLNEQTYLNLQLEMMTFFDSSQSYVFGQIFDSNSQSILDYSPQLLEQIAANKCLFSNNTSQSNVGIILLNNQPMIIASHIILTSEGEGPSRGTLIVGRYLDDSELRVLSEAAGVAVSVSVYGSSQAGADFAVAQQHLSKDKPIFSQALNETTFAGYILMEDINGIPVLVARVADARTDLATRTTAMVYTGLVLIVICATTFLAIAVLLDKIVVSRLSALSNTVGKIRGAGNNSKRVTVEGKDELSSLSDNINGMLDVIDKNTLSLEQKVNERTKDLIENQKKLQSILSASPDAILATDLNGNITECNNQMQQLCGLEKSDLLGKHATSIVDKKDNQQLFDTIVKLIEGNMGIIRLEASLVRIDHTKFLAEILINTIRNEQNNPVGMVAIIRDLSEKKQLESRLFRSERLAAIGELAGMVGHDLRNPLAAIKNANYLLKKKCSRCKEHNSLQMFEIIDLSIEHANKIVNDLLDYSREIHLEPTESSPKKILQHALALVQIPPKINFVDNTLDSKLVVDEDKVVRVFVNLIKNACDAMPEGGKLEITSTEQNDIISVKFIDSGVGITPEVQQKMFTPLFTTKAKGMGFGLPISKRIVEAHGGKVSMESNLGNGTTFTLTFPKNRNTIDQITSKIGS